MLLPISDDMNDYDDPDFVMPWWMIVSTAFLGVLRFVLLTPAAWLIGLFSRRPKGEFADPIKAALAKAGEG